MGPGIFNVVNLVGIRFTNWEDPSAFRLSLNHVNMGTGAVVLVNMYCQVSASVHYISGEETGQRSAGVLFGSRQRFTGFLGSG